MKQYIVFVVLLFASFPAISEEYSNEDYFYSIELPSDFSLADDSEGYDALFQNEAADAFYEVTVFDLEVASGYGELFDEIVARFEGKGSYAKTTFCQYDAARGTVTFTMDGYPLKMDLIVTEDPYFYYVVMGYSLSSSFNKYQKTLASISQSFKIHYDDEVYGNDSTTATTKEPENKLIEEKNTKTSGTKGTYDELRPSWDKYKPVFQFLKSDLRKAQEELDDIANSNSWERYGVDPYGPDANAKFWHQFYIDMYKKNYYRVNTVVDWFKEKAKSEGWSSYDLAVNVIKALQSIVYGSPEKLAEPSDKSASELGFFTPNEVAYYNKGDCDTKSLFIVLILKRLGYDAAMFYSEVYSHAMVALNINATGTYMSYKGKKYYFVESTYPGWAIGQISEDWNDVSNWYLLPIN